MASPSLTKLNVSGVIQAPPHLTAALKRAGLPDSATLIEACSILGIKLKRMAGDGSAINLSNLADMLAAALGAVKRVQTDLARVNNGGKGGRGRRLKDGGAWWRDERKLILRDIEREARGMRLSSVSLFELPDGTIKAYDAVTDLRQEREVYREAARIVHARGHSSTSSALKWCQHDREAILALGECARRRHGRPDAIRRSVQSKLHEIVVTSSKANDSSSPA
jgi:hypothetical protein